ncbi:hypothetical protein [Sodalis-like endosymbiont of Proechinophthirus fluctus]|uniref:hypothetical protein n=1 Tax=Sodalis-like endosymbiont of Proechinophthirus fluctus TaxID=1462730 RepID=UPI00082F8ED9|nr:hypothetical protein [Sodalis-like endosymbiont of Proechinophthirus fluctus]
MNGISPNDIERYRHCSIYRQCCFSIFCLARFPPTIAALAPYLSRPAKEWFIAINLFTGAEDKDFPCEQVESLIAHLRRREVCIRVFLIGRGDFLNH